MPKPLKKKEVAHALIKLGFQEKMTKSGHRTYKKQLPNGKILITQIPFSSKKELTPGTLGSVLRNIGMTKNELIEFIRK